MNPFYCIFKSRAALIFALLPAFVAGCGGGGSLDPILATPSVAAVATLTDTTRPTVVLTAPGAGAVAVAINRRVTATFSEGMSAATLTGTSFTLRNTTPGAAVAGTVSYSVASRTATFAPTGATLAINSLFTATITTAATDSAGNALAGNAAVAPGAGNHVWTFTTGATADLVAPTITAISPPDASTAICLTRAVTATFSEALGVGKQHTCLNQRLIDFELTSTAYCSRLNCRYFAASAWRTL